MQQRHLYILHIYLLDIYFVAKLITKHEMIHLEASCTLVYCGAGMVHDQVVLCNNCT